MCFLWQLFYYYKFTTIAQLTEQLSVGKKKRWYYLRLKCYSVYSARNKLLSSLRLQTNILKWKQIHYRKYNAQNQVPVIDDYVGFWLVLNKHRTINIITFTIYYIVTVYANNSVGRSPNSNSVTTRTDIDRKLLCYMSIYYFVCPFCLHYTSIKSLHVCHIFTFNL